MRLSLSVLLVVIMMGTAASAGGGQLPAIEYLSDLPECLSFHQQGWGELGINVAAHAPGQTPLKLKVNDQDFSNGLGTHAPGEIIIDLDGQYTTFEAEVGVQWQQGSVGSVTFQVFVDGRKRFDSGLMRESTPARPVKVSVADADELRLVVTDGGDGIACDCANWLGARLTRATSARARKPSEALDVAPFARVITFDPSRTDGCRANRVQEFHTDDLFPETEVRPEADGSYKVPIAESGQGCIGLQWIERRRVSEIGLDLSGAPPEGVEVQAWVGESRWQGHWEPVKGAVERREGGLAMRIDYELNGGIGTGTRKTRWIFPKGSQPVVVRKLWAYSSTRTQTAELTLQTEKPLPGRFAEIEMYNGAIAEGTARVIRKKWDMGKPLSVKLVLSRLGPARSERTVMRLRLPETSFGVAIDDVMTRECVYVREAGVFVVKEPTKISLEEYRRRIASEKTILERVRRLPDQTIEQAMAKTRNPIQDNGPVLLSLACDNRKFLVQREGAIQFEQHPEADAEIAVRPLQTSCAVTPTFGGGKAEFAERKLDGGWIPVPVIVHKEGAVSYTERVCVSPFDGSSLAEAPDWAKSKPLCVAEFVIQNGGGKSADARLKLDLVADAQKGAAAEIDSVDSGAAVHANGRLLAWVNTSGASPLKVEIEDGALIVSGSLPARGAATLSVTIPGWVVAPGGYRQFPASDKCMARTGAYWTYMLANTTRIEVPDRLLSDVVRASQVHCLMAARNEEGGARVAPWIASMVYGPLESECNSIIRGMMMLGHDDFARRCLEFYIHRYSPEGMLTTGYTLMGTGWHLWTLGEYYDLTHNTEWLKQVAPNVDRVCQWVVRQREKTKKLDSTGRKVPEYGLMPPGVQADWNSFGYHYSLNGYYYAGLVHAARALADVGSPDAASLLADAEEFRKEMLRAYEWTQSLMPVFALRNGTWVTGYPGQVYTPGPTNDFFPGEDGNRSWCYDVELGAHQLVPQGVLDPKSPEVDRMLDHMEDVQFLAQGWFDYDAEGNERDWFDRGGFAKVQPYYCRNAEIYAMRDDVKPFIRSYFNALASLLNTEVLSFWEHFHCSGAWNKTHETGYFLQQTRFMMVMEHGDELWLAPFVTNEWMEDGKSVAATNAPTRFGEVSYRITSHTAHRYIEAKIDPPTRTAPSEIVIRLRHPEGKRMRSVTVNGAKHTEFDPAKEIVRIKPTGGAITVRAEY